jgi:hypothetical protein
MFVLVIIESFGNETCMENFIGNLTMIEIQTPLQQMTPQNRSKNPTTKFAISDMSVYKNSAFPRKPHHPEPKQTIENARK